MKHIEATAPPPYGVPDDGLKKRIERELVTPIGNPEAPPDERRAAIRLLAVCGYPWRAEALIDALEDSDESLRPEALRALEDIAGERRGSDPQAWRAWLAALPQGVVAQGEPGAP